MRSFNDYAITKLGDTVYTGNEKVPCDAGLRRPFLDCTVATPKSLTCCPLLAHHQA